MERARARFGTTGGVGIAALAAGIAPFVRVPANTPEYISRVLDGGALGVIAPHIGSAAQARAVVAAARFPPAGERSAPGAPPHLPFPPFPLAPAHPALHAPSTGLGHVWSRPALAPAR